MSVSPPGSGAGACEAEPSCGSRLFEPALLAVDVATAVLRRGVPVVVSDGPGDAALVLAIEAAPAGASELMSDLCGSRPRLLWSGARGGLAERMVAKDAGDDLEPMPGMVLPTLRLNLLAGSPPDDDEAPQPGSSEAAVRLAKLAGLLPAVLSVPLPSQVEDARAWSAERHFPYVRAVDVASYQDHAAASLRPVSQALVPLSEAETARIVAFRAVPGSREHIAVIVGQPDPGAAPLVRLHSACMTGDLLASLRCDCGDQLRGAIAAMAAAGGGVLLYLAQEGRGIGLVNKLRAYELQDLGLDTIDANWELGFEADERFYRPAAEMLRQLGFHRVRLMTNNPEKITALAHYGISVVERVAHAFPANVHNVEYLRTKALRAGHALPLEDADGVARGADTARRRAQGDRQDRG